MSSTPDITDRRVAGLARRRPGPDPASLIAANRSVAQTEPDPSATTPPAAPPRPDEPAQLSEPEQAAAVPAEPERPNRSRRQPPKPAPETDDSNPQDAPKKVTVYLHQSVRDRAAVAFKATAYLEQDESWSHLVEKALLAEVERREAAHNAGRPFAADNAQLKRGRSIR